RHLVRLSPASSRAATSSVSSNAATRLRTTERPALTSTTAAGDSAAQTKPAPRSRRMQSSHGMLRSSCIAPLQARPVPAVACAILRFETRGGPRDPRFAQATCEAEVDRQLECACEACFDAGRRPGLGGRRRRCSRRGTRQREVDREDAPGPRNVAHPERAAARLHALAADVEPQPEPDAIPRSLLEGLEELLDPAGREPPALVFDLDPGALVDRRRPQSAPSALPGELERVLEKGLIAPARISPSASTASPGSVGLTANETPCDSAPSAPSLRTSSMTLCSGIRWRCVLPESTRTSTSTWSMRVLMLFRLRVTISATPPTRGARPLRIASKPICAAEIRFRSSWAKAPERVVSASAIERSRSRVYSVMASAMAL